MRLSFLSQIVIMVSTPPLAWSATLPSGFSDGNFAGGLSRPTAMEFAPDGRLFVAEQGGALRVIKQGNLLPGPFVSLTVDSRGERGLLGVATDPNFSVNRYVFVYHTVPGTPAHNRVSRFIANGDKALAGSQRIILELNALSSATNHNGGAIHFGADKKLYVAVGDNAHGSNSKSLSTRLGKMLRINADGTIPSDNPTSFQAISGTSNGVNKAIWAAGLRNPFTFAIEAATAKMFINDVGQLSWEEINVGRRGANYGWPIVEGRSNNPSFTGPVYAYSHDSAAVPTGCAITGGTFYRPRIPRFPAKYVDKYFFADYCGRWIYYIDSANPTTATRFATDLATIVDLKVGPDGALYYLARDLDSVRRIRYVAQTAQSMILSADKLTINEGEDEVITVALAKEPSATVTVSIANILSRSVNVFPDSLTFTSFNWDTPKEVVISAVDDSDKTDDGATLTFSSSGLAAQRLVVTAKDNDRPPGAPRAVISLPQNGNTVSGRTAEYFGDGIDNVGVVKADFYVDGIWKYTDTNSTGHYHYRGDHNRWGTTGLTAGYHTLRMKVYDSEGLSGAHLIRIRVAN